MKWIAGLILGVFTFIMFVGALSGSNGFILGLVCGALMLLLSILGGNKAGLGWGLLSGVILGIVFGWLVHLFWVGVALADVIFLLVTAMSGTREKEFSGGRR